MVVQIAASAQDQATGLSQVNTAVNQMDQSTQQNAAMMEQATAAAAGLKTETEHLAELIGRFKTGAPAAPARQAPGPKRPVLRAVPTRGRAGSVVPFRETASAGNDWKEF